MVNRFPFRSRFEMAAALAAGTTVVLAALDTAWAVLPPILFLALVLIGPFVQRLQFFLPVIRKGDGGRPEVSLTFDDGPDPDTTPLLLDLLACYRVRATFFVIGRKVFDNPDLIRKILENGHDIGNHSDSHDVFLMLRGREIIEREIRGCQDRLAQFSIRPKAFRPPVGITNPHLRPLLEKLDLDCIGFSCRPLDFGNRRIEGMADRVLYRIRSGDILLLHDCSLYNAATPSQWLEEIKTILEGLQDRELKIVPLSRLINRSVMETTGTAE